MAIITDKLRLINCSNFIKDVSFGGYYTFIGFPNSSSLYPNWDSSRPDPKDNFLYLNSYRDNILGVKKLTNSDVVRVIPKVIWTSGKKYEMYRHDYGVKNLSPVTKSTRLYDSSYYVMNQDYRVYICINNNSEPNTNLGSISTQEPLHTDLSPREESDGYVWKYLYTLSPADVLKFDSTDYVSVPNDWETTENIEVSRIRTNAVNGKIETVIIENNVASYSPPSTIVTDVPIEGDGAGAFASVEFNETGNPIKVVVTSGGSEYTFGTLNLDSILQPTGAQKAVFNVIIPPPGGHGANVYTELGAYRALVYSRIENNPTNPDFIVGNQFSRIGIIKNIQGIGAATTFSSSTGSGVSALKLVGNASAEPYDSIITQENTKAIGTIVSFDSTTKVLKYIQPRNNNIDTYVDGDGNYQIDLNEIPLKSISGIQTSSNYDLNLFDNSNIKINGNTYSISGGFNGSSVDVGGTTYYLGQTFNGGVSVPDINIKSGEILYVDNRASVTRSTQQREDIKIILEF
jgi:hypothetical protein